MTKGERMDESDSNTKKESSKVDNENRRRKKRLSRREQKARKKLKVAAPTEGISLAPTEQSTSAKKGAPPDEVTAQNDQEDYDESYVPTPRPSGPHQSQKQSTKKSLGKWFPKAVVLKSLAPPSDKHEACIVLFYQYVNALWPESYLSGFISYLCQIAERRCLGGRIRVAREGVNATLSSRDTETSSARRTLRHLARDLQAYHDVFRQTDFKYMDGLSGDRHFKDFKVFPVQELVFYGLPSDKTVGQVDLGSMEGGVHLSAEEFHKKLTDPDTVVVDVRNHYESVLGRFDGQQHIEFSTNQADVNDSKAAKQSETTKTTGPTKLKGDKNDDDDGGNKESPKADEKKVASTAAAEYIDPKMRKSTDWTRWLEQDDTQKKLEGKQVLLYCTGGIRCERASVYMNHKMGDKVKGIYQLKGGIERYFKAFPEGGHWRGANFTFDKREAVDVRNPNGDGGVITKDSSSKSDGRTTLLPEAKCCRCDKPWNRYVGKKKCHTCGVPVLVCDACLSQKSASKSNSSSSSSSNNNNNNNKVPKELQQQLRCPLCVQENVTVAARDVEFTDNGKSGKTAVPIEGTVAPSVLKWGGGHAAQKKDKRRFQRKPCRYGAHCQRKDCFFAHPEKDDDRQAEEARS